MRIVPHANVPTTFTPQTIEQNHRLFPTLGKKLLSHAAFIETG
jgi:hypothetical protein